MPIRSLLLLLATLGIGPGALANQNQNYPFVIDTQKEGDSYRIVARNDGPAPVSVKVTIPEWRGVTTDRPFPVFAVVPPRGGVLHLGQVRAATQGVGFSFKTQSQWILGDFNAVQSRDAIYRLPFRNGLTFRIGQSPGGPITTHTSPQSTYAVDIPMPEGTPIVAARDGVVIYTEANQVYGAKSPDLLTKANEVRIQHVDGTIAIYAHMEHGGVHVYPGQKVTEGTQIGLAGSTGYSSGPHLHFAVQTVRRTSGGEGMEVVSLPFRFYVGNPPTEFSPAYGMQALAEYGPRQTSPAPQVSAPQAPRVPQGSPSTESKKSTNVSVSLEVPAPVRSFLLGVPVWGWVVALLGVWALIAALSWRVQTRSLRRHDFREPVFGHTDLPGNHEDARTARAQLIEACGGDSARADKLIELEHEKSPNINLSDDEAALRALGSIRK